MIYTHPAGTLQIVDKNNNNCNFWPIEVNGLNFPGIFPFKNLQKSQTFEHHFKPWSQ